MHLELAFEDRSLMVYFFFKNKMIINYERHFPKKFRCTFCKEKVESDGSKMKFCDEHYQEFMEFLKRKIK